MESLGNSINPSLVNGLPPSPSARGVHDIHRKPNSVGFICKDNTTALTLKIIKVLQ